MESSRKIEIPGIKPREVLDQTETILERLADSPALFTPDRERVASIRRWSDELARATIANPDTDRRNSIFQEYIPALRALADDDTFWVKVGDTVPTSPIVRDPAIDFLSDPDSYLASNTPKDERDRLIKSAEQDVAGTPTADVRASFKQLTVDMEKLFLSHGHSHVPTRLH